MKIENEVAYQIAASLIAAEGDEPEYMSIVGTVGGYADEEGLVAGDEVALLTEVEALVRGAKIEITFHDEVVMRL